ncbi:MAG: PhoH family protein [Myxococcota bacterium]
MQLQDERMLQCIGGVQQKHLRLISSVLGVRIGARGNVLYLTGGARVTEAAVRLFEQLQERVLSGHSITEQDVRCAAHALQDNPKAQVQFEQHVLSSQSGQSVVPKGSGQENYVQAMKKNDITFAIGPAGTGKTFLAMAYSIQQLRSKKCERIVLTRPAIEAGERLGFLPGDLEEKISPYLRPLNDALFDLAQPRQARELLEQGIIEIAPLAFMRGRTLSDAFVILDEAQNTTPQQMKMFLTRLGFGSKMVITGDITQVDLPIDQQSGLVEATQLLHETQGIAICHLTQQDVVRHPLVGRIVNAYENGERRGKQG